MAGAKHKEAKGATDYSAAHLRLKIFLLIFVQGLLLAGFHKFLAFEKRDL